jgi:TonB family protein
MTQHADILDEHDSLRGAFLGAIGLHVTVVGAIAIYGSMVGHTQFFGSKDAGGGAIGIEAVNSIPLQHRGMPNPLANDTKSEIPEQPAKPIERQKEEKPPPDAIALKSRKAKKPPAQVASERQRFRPFKELEQNQLTVKESPAVASPMFSAIPGAGRVGIGANTTLGTRFAGYAQQIQQLVAQKWRTSDIDPRVQTAPVVIVMFDLLRDGSVRNLRILQRSGIPALDFSAQRAILEASPFPPIPPGFEHDVAEIESDFELKR